MDEKIKRIVEQRQIDTLYHFTQAENLSNIFKYGLLSRKTLEEKKYIESHFSDDKRDDDCRQAVCMSIEFPNSKMFYIKQVAYSKVDWVVLELDARILYEYDCAFCEINAANHLIREKSFEERMGAEAFKILFRPSNAETQCDWYPFDVQAEVLVRLEHEKNIPASYIENIYFKDRETYDKYRKKVPDGIDVTVNSKFFGKYLCDSWYH